jgi:hypothetical protein
MKTQTQQNNVIAIGKTFKGSTFVGTTYRNAQGELSRQLIVSGITYENLLLNDFESLQANQNVVFSTLEKQYSTELITLAYNNLYSSLEKRLSSDETKAKLLEQNDTTIVRSQAQKDAYTHVAKGIKVHNDTNEIHVFGLCVKKTVLEPIEYKETKSKELTIVQNKIKKLCDFKQNKYKTFIFQQGEFKMKGLTL